MNDLSEEKLVAASADGDKDAYSLLVDKYYKKISLVCLGIIGNVHDAEDIAQETVLKGFMEISKLRKQSQFGPWLTKIARNLSINYVNKKKRNKQLLEKRITTPVLKTSQNENLQRAILELPMEMRLPLIMYYYDGQSISKVAESLNMSTSAVYSRLQISIKELHNVLNRQKNEQQL